MAYRHTQVSRLALGIAGVQALGVAAMLASPAVPWVPAAILGAVLPVPLIFSRLTTEVDGGELRFWFGGGFWRTRIPLAAITSVEPVRNSWWWGWGIRITPDGWLYNVAGVDAIRVAQQNGITLRIGTDEPRELARAVEKAVTYKHEGHEGHEDAR
ncbi:MAG: hypothetical protein Q8L86_10855 [Vicinamibacterales bacterium]|nr:hypothetical protein [Vicinamibacterales bacterium]